MDSQSKNDLTDLQTDDPIPTCSYMDTQKYHFPKCKALDKTSYKRFGQLIHGFKL